MLNMLLSGILYSHTDISPLFDHSQSAISVILFSFCKLYRVRIDCTKSRACTMDSTTWSLTIVSVDEMSLTMNEVLSDDSPLRCLQSMVDRVVLNLSSSSSSSSLFSLFLGGLCSQRCIPLILLCPDTGNSSLDLFRSLYSINSLIVTFSSSSFMLKSGNRSQLALYMLFLFLFRFLLMF